MSFLQRNLLNRFRNFPVGQSHTVADLQAHSPPHEYSGYSTEGFITRVGSGVRFIRDLDDNTLLAIHLNIGGIVYDTRPNNMNEIYDMFTTAWNSGDPQIRRDFTATFYGVSQGGRRVKRKGSRKSRRKGSRKGSRKTNRR